MRIFAVPFLSTQASLYSPQRWSRILLLMGVMFLCAGCVTLTDTEASQGQRQDVIANLQPGQSFRQGFISQRARLNQVILWIQSNGNDSPPDAEVQIKLYRAAGEPQLLAQLQVPIKALTGSGEVALSVPPIKNSQGERFLVDVSSPQSPIQVMGRLEDVYAGGEASVGGQFLLADAAFQLSYDYDARAALQDSLHMLQLGWLVLPLGALLLLPGWLLFDLSGRPARLDWGERVALYLGLSLAVFPVVMTWTSLVNLGWTQPGLLAAVGFLTAAALYRLWITRRLSRSAFKAAWQRLHSKTDGILQSGPTINLGLVAIFLITLLVRFAMVRDLSASPWVDSVHHALTARLIMQQGVFPQSYAPFLNIDPQGYHPGFHAVLASFLWLSGMELVEGMLVFGQVLNALMVFPIYLFATMLTRRRLAGLLAALIAGLLSPMPAYYTSWGRYTQLAGLAIFPAALVLLLWVVKTGKWRVVFLAGLALAGLLLTHYRVAAFLACLLLAWGLIAGLGMIRMDSSARQDKIQSVRKAILPFLGAGCLAVGLAIPVLVPAFITVLAPKMQAWRPPTRDSFSGVTWPYLNTAWGSYALVLAGLGFLWSLIRRKTYGIVLLLWSGFLFILANLGALGLPGSGFVNTISATISLFLPIAVLGGDMLAELAQAWRSALPWRWRPIFRWALAASALTIAVFASRPMLGLLNSGTFLYRPADRQAIAWVAENVPEGETVLVNPFAWGYGQYAGNDGGYWVSALGDRPTMPPPVLYGLSNSTEYIQHINSLSQQVIDQGGNPEGLHALLVKEGIHYVFIGQRGGPISPSALRSSPLFAPRYARDGAFIFEVMP